jgi:hypothetical protein
MVNNVKEIRERVPADETASSLFVEFGKNLGEVLAAYIKSIVPRQLLSAEISYMHGNYL